MGAASINTKNNGHEDRLTNQYRHLYFYDRDVLEIRRIIQIEWKQRANGLAAQHACVTALIENVDEVARVTGGTDGDEEEVYESYYINEIMQEMIKDAPHPYNSGLTMVGV